MEQITLRFPSQGKQSYYPGSKGWNNHYQTYRHEAFGESGVEKTNYQVPMEKTKYSGYVKASGLPTFAYKIPDGKIWKSAPYSVRLPRGGSVPRIIGTSSEGTSTPSANIGTQTQEISEGTQTQGGQAVVTGTPGQTVGVETQTPGQTRTVAGTQTVNVPERLPEYKPPTPTYEKAIQMNPELNETFTQTLPEMKDEASTQIPSPKSSISASSMGPLVETPSSAGSFHSTKEMSVSDYYSAYSREIPQEQTTYAGNIQSILMEPPQVQTYLEDRADTNPNTTPSNIPIRRRSNESYASQTIRTGLDLTDRMTGAVEGYVWDGMKYIANTTVSGVVAGSKMAMEGIKAIAKSKGKQKMVEGRKVPVQYVQPVEKKSTPKPTPIDTKRMTLRSHGPASLPEVTYMNYAKLKNYQLVRLLNTIGIYPKSNANKTNLKQMVEENKYELFGTLLMRSVRMPVTPK